VHQRAPGVITPASGVAPLGATVTADGVHFALYAPHAAGVELLLFDGPGQPAPSRAITLDPAANFAGGYWHVAAPGIGAGQLYGYRAHGPHDPARGLRFDPAKLLLDPYARAVVDDAYRRGDACALGADNTATALYAVVVDPDAYDWEGDAPLGRPLSEAVIYELHVRGFTRHPSSGLPPERRGTYAGLIAKIPYLQALGVTAVELMPVQQFDAQAAPPPLPNYWGYEPIAWLAPHRAYSSRRDPLGPVDEFRDMVKALHRAGIEVYVDVVYNHTAEDNEHGPTLSLRGLANEAYYMLDPRNRAWYRNYSGVGNSFNANHPVARRLVLDSLRYWVEQLHVDGFRFDLAASLARGQDGAPSPLAPVLLDIDTDPVLSRTKIIAEAWDAGGLYMVGGFPGDRWAVWNGPFRDTARRFVKSDGGMVGRLADAIGGSPSVFHDPERNPLRSVNFVTAHDGFTLNDLVSYNEKHNEANLLANTDGADDNASWNCGAEGPTADPAVEALRGRQVRNFLTVLLLSQGRPMLLMGDEVRRTQRGNNNGFNQDSPLSWFDWDDLERHADVLRFTRLLLRFRRASGLFADRRFWFRDGGADVRWHGVELGRPDWGAGSRSLAYELSGPGGAHLHVMLNAYWEPLSFALPPLPPGLAWRRLLDTGLPPPADICDPPAPLPADTAALTLGPRSAAALVALPTAQEGATP
jgi:glycogen operon protein